MPSSKARDSICSSPTSEGSLVSCAILAIHKEMAVGQHQDYWYFYSGSKDRVNLLVEEQ